MKNCKCCPLSLLIEESHHNKCKNCPYGQRKTLLKKLPIYRKFRIYCIVCTLYKLSVLYCLLCLYSCIIYPVCSVKLHCMHHLVWSAWNCETWSKLGCKYAPRLHTQGGRAPWLRNGPVLCLLPFYLPGLRRHQTTAVHWSNWFQFLSLLLVELPYGCAVSAKYLIISDTTNRSFHRDGKQC